MHKLMTSLSPFLVLIMLLFAVPAQASVAELKPSVNPERLATEQWLKDIPDYEKRLYERVKKSNNRELEILRFVIISAVIIIILVPLLTFFLLRKFGYVGGGQYGKGVGAAPHQAVNHSNTLNQLVKRQKSLLKAHDQLLSYVEGLHADRKSMESLVRSLRSEMDLFESDFAAALKSHEDKT